MPSPLADRYAINHGGIDAGCEALARDLMRDDPATFKRGYTADNAALAASEMFGFDSDYAVDLAEKLK